jgi:sec-independent protein translocase protein TatB
VFDLSVTKLLVLAVIALVVFGPHELPKIAQQAGRALRDLRRIAEGAKADLREGLGPEFQDFDFEDLNPRRFVRKHLLDDEMEDSTRALFDEFKDTSSAIMGGAGAATTATAATAATMTGSQRTATLPDGEDPPFDIEAT